MSRLLQFLINNKEWVFSGIGVAAISAFVAFSFSSQQNEKKGESFSGKSSIGNVAGRDIYNSPISIGETPELRNQRLHETQSALSQELMNNLSALASQITWTIITQPEEPNIPRRPGETKAQFEDRARDEFARWLEYLARGYQQFPLSEVTYIAQKQNIAALEKSKSRATENAYVAIRESRSRIFLYREYLNGLLDSNPSDTVARINRASLLKEETINALTSHWFDILGNLLLIEQDESNIRMLEEIILPEIVTKEHQPKSLKLGTSGWQYTRQQMARLAQEKVDLLIKSSKLSASSKNSEDESNSPSEIVSKAGLAFLEGQPTDALKFLEKALRMDISTDQRHYLEISLDYLNNPDKYDGVLGAYLMNVDASGAADKVGLQKGDVILRYNNQLVSEPIELSKMIPMTKSAPAVEVEFLRAGNRMKTYLKGGTGMSATATTLVVAMPIAI